MAVLCVPLLGLAQVSPQAYWTFDLNGTDASGNNRHVSLLNGAAVTTGTFIIGSGALGGEGASGALDGAAPPNNDFARADGNSGGSAWAGVTGSTARSASVWFNAPPAQPGQNPVFLSWGSTANGTRFELRLDRLGGTGGGVVFPSDSVRVEIAGNFICTTNGGYADGQWHHVLAAFPGGSSAADYNAMRFFVDGKPVGHTPTNAAVGINTGTANNLFIAHGILNGSDRPLSGYLDDIGVYAVELDATDAALIHGLGRIHGIGLDQLSAAQTLWSSLTGGTAFIGGKTWTKTSNLPGLAGDWGGSWDLDTAYIVVDDVGGGIALGSTGSTFVWIGQPPGDGLTLFDEANWLDTISGTAPAAGSIDPSVNVAATLVITNGTPGGTVGASGHLQLGGRSLVIRGGTLRLDTAGAFGIRDDANVGDDTSRSVVTLTGGTVIAQFLGEISLNLGGDGLVALNGPSNPLNASVVEFTTNTCSLVFSNRTPAEVMAAYLDQVQVQGAPASVGGDPAKPEFGDNLVLTASGAGCIVRAVTGPDIDGDGLPDAWEHQYFGDLDELPGGDPDEDSLTTLVEFERGTNPSTADTDNDGLRDDVETGTGVWVGIGNTGTDPLRADTDNDGLKDGVENNTGVLVGPDQTGTSPLEPNSDGDRFKDGAEVAQGTDPNQASSQADLPNVILIMADDLGLGELGAYGQAKILTPNIDRLANEGMKFTRFYSPAPVCAPTRCQLLTGKHSGRAYVRDNGEVGNGYQLPLPPKTYTLGTLMQQAGYVTGCVGKWGLGGENTTGLPWLQGFDHFFGYLGQVQAHHYYASRLWRNSTRAYYSPTLAGAEGGSVDIPGAGNETGFDNLSLSLGNKNNNGNVHSHDAMTREALNWIRSHTNEAFFLYLAYTVPHVSIQPPGHIEDITDSDGLVFDNAVRTCVDEFYPTNPVTGLRPFGAPISHPGSGHYSATPDKRHEYAAMISAMDRDVGRIRALLESAGLGTNTLFIFTSDNGVSNLGEVDYNYFNSNADLRGYKGNLYEGGIRAPFIAWWPGRIRSGATSALIGAFDDVMPTLAELTSTVHPPDVTGRSILPTLLGRPSSCQKPRDHIYFEFKEGSNWTRAVRNEEWKLRRSISTSGGAYSYSLYHLPTDPAEANNVASANPAIVAALERRMDGAHLPAEHFFRPADELPVLNGVTLSYGTLGLRLNGSGTGVVSLERDITNRVVFEFTLKNTGGMAANGALLFGEGSDAMGLVRAEVDISAGHYRISHGGNLATASLPAGLNPAGEFAIKLTWEPTNATVTLQHGTNILALQLASPPNRIDHVGYSVAGSQTDFTPATLHIAAAPLVWKGWCLEGEVFHLAYERPTLISGLYLNEESTNLVEWLPVGVLREQPITGFGSVQAVSVDIRDRSRDPSAPASLFYRIRYVP